MYLQKQYLFQCDLENFDEIRTMFEWIENEPELGRVDICIPNAGLSANTSLLDGTIHISNAFFNAHFTIDTKQPFHKLITIQSLLFYHFSERIFSIRNKSVN